MDDGFEVFGTVAGGVTHGVGETGEPPAFVAAALLVEVALFVVIGALGFTAVALPVVLLDPVVVVVDVAEPLAVTGAGTVPAGHGELALVLDVVVPLVPGVAAAPAGTFEFGFVVDVADAGVLFIGVGFVVPFCCVAGVAELGVVPGAGAIPCVGVMP